MKKIFLFIIATLTAAQQSGTGLERRSVQSVSSPSPAATRAGVPPVSEEPLVRVNTRLVEVHVVVRARNGPVEDLKPGDFTLFDQGKPQRIATFSVSSTQDRPAHPASLPMGTVSNRLEGLESSGATVVLFDRLNTAPEDQANARVAFLAYLHGKPAGEPLSIFVVNKTLRVIQDFTADKDRLIEAASHASPERSLDEGTADLVSDLPITGNPLTDAMTANAAAEMMDNAMRNRAEITAFALGAIAKHLARLPGRKKLVWITAAFPASYTYTGRRNLSTQIENREFSGKIEQAARLLNDANIAVYPIDPRPLTTDALAAPGIDTMNLFAAKTGGVAQYALGDITGAIQTAMQDSGVTYSLGFYPSRDKLDGSYHSLHVKVARGGLELSYRQGYLATEARLPADKQRGFAQ